MKRLCAHCNQWKEIQGKCKRCGTRKCRGCCMISMDQLRCPQGAPRLPLLSEECVSCHQEVKGHHQRLDFYSGGLWGYVKMCLSCHNELKERARTLHGALP